MQKNVTKGRVYVPIKIGAAHLFRLSAQTLRIMRMLSFFMFVVGLHVSARTTSQQITYSGKNVPIDKVIVEVKKQVDYGFFFNENLLQKTTPVTVTANNMPLEAFLQLILKNQPLAYRIDDQTIFLFEKKETLKHAELDFLNQDSLPKFSISGIVKEIDGTILSGATVFVKGTSIGTTTNMLGNFNLGGVTKQSVIVVSYIGYVKEEIIMTEKTSKEQLLTVILKSSDNLLDETLITAYGSTTRRLATGSIGTVKAKEIERQPVLTALEALVGRVPGLIIKPTSGNGAAGVQVEIRGRNTLNQNAVADPLYVIDGIPLTYLNAGAFTGNVPFSMGAAQAGITNTPGENPLLSINPRDIESIDVLMDADATAIYGSRGANGVILITTKKAKSGPARVSLRLANGFKSLQKYPKLLNTQEYLAVRREAFQNDGITPNRYSAPDLTIWDSTRYTDWQRRFIGTGSTSNIDLGISGGLAQTNYSVSIGLDDQKEIMNNDGKNRRNNFRSYFGHSGLDQKFNLSIRNNLSITNVNAFAIGNLGSIAPNAPDIYNEKGTFNFEPYRRAYDSGFPFSGLIKNSKSKSLMLQSSMNLSYKLFKGLEISTNMGYNYTTNENANYTPSAAQDPQFRAISMAYFGNSSTNSWNIEPQMAYTGWIGKGKLSMQLIGSAQAVETKGATIIGQMFPNDAMMKSVNNAATKLIMEGYKEYKYLSGASVINYNWENKYILNLNGRRDGSSRFGDDKQFGNFGSIGLAWIASEEEWFGAKMPDWLSFLKFRGSMGIGGSDAVGDYEYLSRWSNGFTLDGAQMPAYNGTNAFHVVRPLNQQFQWESTRKMDFAVSFGLLNDKLNIDVNYYRNVTNKQLTQVPTGEYTGFASVTGNWGAVVENKGLAITLAANLISKNDWNVSMNFNFGINRNKLLDFPGLARSPHAANYTIGKSLSLFYAFKYLGVDPLTGTYSFEDRNKDGRLYSDNKTVPQSPEDDRYVVLELNEKFSGGFGFSTMYKSLSLFTQFSYINRLSEDPYAQLIPGIQNNIYLPKDIADNHWKQPGDLAKYARYSMSYANLGRIAESDANYINGSYMRLTNISLSYQLPENWLRKVKIKDVSLAISTQNLFTLTSFKGYDPDITSAINATPIPRTFATILTFNF